MKHFSGSVVIGVVLLAGLVAFALLPGAGDAHDAAYDDARQEVAVLADETACRSYLLGVDRSGVDRAVVNIEESLTYERENGLDFYDWLQADAVSEALLVTADAARSAASVPGISDEVFDDLRSVMASATALEAAAVSSDMFLLADIEESLEALTGSLDEARGVCA